MASSARGELAPDAVQMPSDRHAIAVVLGSAGYPGKPRKGDVINGCDWSYESQDSGEHTLCRCETFEPFFNGLVPQLEAENAT